MLADMRLVAVDAHLGTCDILFCIFFDQSLEFANAFFFLLLHLFPKGNGISVTLGVFDVISLDAPERFMLLDILLHQIVDVIVLHDEYVMNNTFIIS